MRLTPEQATQAQHTSRVRHMRIALCWKAAILRNVKALSRQRRWVGIAGVVLVSALVLACSGTTSGTTDASPTLPTPDIQATIRAAVDATATAQPTPTSIPTPTPTPAPTPNIPATITAALQATMLASPSPIPTSSPTRAPTPSPLPTPAPTPTLEQIIARARPAIVRIRTTTSTASGVIFEVAANSQSALVLTNAHAVPGTGVDVIVNDRVKQSGTIIGLDAKRDLAVLRICCSADYKSLDFGDASGLQVGTRVMAFGYALGLEGEASVTTGIVSAKRREEEGDRSVIQTDASLNPGNSGGPLLSMDGSILGITTFKYAGSNVSGLGFAVSQETIARVLPSLRSGALAPTPTPTPFIIGRCLIQPGIDCSFADLRSANLAQQDLSGMRFTSADLSGADLSGANLTRAFLLGANLTGANLTGAILHEAWLSETNFTSANFTGADLRWMIVLKADFRGANFTDADLRWMDVVQADFRGANFTRADLRTGGVNSSTPGAIFCDTLFPTGKRGADCGGKTPTPVPTETPTPTPNSPTDVAATCLTPKGIPTLIIPVLGSIAYADQPSQPTFVWMAVAGATGYELQVSVDGTFMNPGNTAIDRTGASRLGNQLAFQPTPGLKPSTTYFWRVRAYFGDATPACVGAWTPASAFRTRA